MRKYLIIGLICGLALLTTWVVASDYYTHFGGVVAEHGFFTGTAGDETEVIDGDGNVTVVNITATGTVDADDVVSSDGYAIWKEESEPVKTPIIDGDGNITAENIDGAIITAATEYKVGNDPTTVIDASANITATAITATGDVKIGTDKLHINDVKVTASAAELNVLDGVTAGTATDDKAVVLGTDKIIDALNITALSLGGAAVTASAAELNVLAGITATTAELNALSTIAITTMDAGHTIEANRLVKYDAGGGHLLKTVVNDILAIGANTSATAQYGEPIRVGLGLVTVEAAQDFEAGDMLKCAADGQAIRWVDSGLAGTQMEAGAGSGVLFTNQPSGGQALQVLSGEGDDTQPVTVWAIQQAEGNGAFSVRKVRVALTGATPVAIEPEAANDWVEVLGMMMDDTTHTGTITLQSETGTWQTVATISNVEQYAGVVPVTDETRAFNAAPTMVLSGAGEHNVGIVGLSTDGTTEIARHKQTDGTTAVAFDDPFYSVEYILTGTLPTDSVRTVTLNVGGPDSETLRIGKALEEATAPDDEVAALILP